MIINFNKKFLNTDKSIFFFILWFFLIIFIYLNKNFFFNEITFNEFYIISSDSHRYINNAKLLIESNFFLENNFLYFSYILFISFVFKLGLGLNSVIAIQLFLTFIGGLCLFEIAKKYINIIAANITLFFYLFYLPLQMMNFYILTDIFFTNLCLIGFYFLFQENKIKVLIGVLILFFASFIRPHGITLLPIIYFYCFFFFKLEKNKIYFFFYALLGSIFFFLILWLINSYPKIDILLKSLASGDIIWGYKFDKKNYDFLINFNQSASQLLNILYFIYFNFYEFMCLAIEKLFWYFSRIRPYYSLVHNLYLVATGLVFYLFFILGIFYKINKLIKYTIFMFILFNSIFVIILFADWSGRFSLYIMPYIFLFSSAGIVKFNNYIKKE